MYSYLLYLLLLTQTKQTEVKVQGNYATVDNRFTGESFLMNVELSPLFYRIKTITLLTVFLT